jgi:hypothetical protein
MRERDYLEANFIDYHYMHLSSRNSTDISAELYNYTRLKPRSSSSTYTRSDINVNHTPGSAGIDRDANSTSPTTTTLNTCRREGPLQMHYIAKFYITHAIHRHPHQYTVAAATLSTGI